ncbi:MAG: hypothetical protein ACK417_07720 [Bacteroidia bacterium]
MKKLFALLLVSGTLFAVACGNASQEAEETTTMEEMVEETEEMVEEVVEEAEEATEEATEESAE